MPAQIETRSRQGADLTSPRKVGFYGCNRKVVRLECKDTEYPRHLRIDCPGCGHEHTVKPAWRRYKPGLDDGKEAILV